MEELALAYVARFATSAAKLERYLKRKLRERGWEDEEAREPDISGLVARYVELGYVDDEAFARAKTGSLLRRGYGARRIGQALNQDGIDEHLREDVAPDEASRRHAVLAFARKRRFGPFGSPSADWAADGAEDWAKDRAVREKQIAAMLRAGHSLDFAREMVDAPTVEAAEAWAAECDEDQDF